ncbi:hypothetical protein NLB33_35240 [Mycolicibacterium smegmatis]|uniref:hypothetical protein n=1 Tax=Mycolicibacterium smegmatis TaxID=1772 RepID=UPI0020A33248|nr:hypothetical protein [Mycolicibacterium smegmatis]MCP2628107.1 hypothetical protein [Mycolicibacterium smegmatis]
MSVTDRNDPAYDVVYVAPDGRKNPFGVEITRAWLTDIEQRTDFWNRTPQLQAIAWAAAQARRVSPWGLLEIVKQNRLSHIKPTVVLVKDSGAEGTHLFAGTSLNSFVALTGESGAGKSKALKLAWELVPPIHTPVSDGTGQGLVKSIAETEKVTKDENGERLAEPYYVTRFHRHSLVVESAEIKTLNAEFERDASKTAAMMRSMWSGETVGMTTGDRDRRVTLPANTYRIVGRWGTHPHAVNFILDGVDDGTPQRFYWVPAEEYRSGISRVNPGTVTFPMPVFGNNGSNPFGTSGGELPTEYRDGDPLPAPIWVHWSPQMAVDIKALQDQRDALRDRDPYEDPVDPDEEAAVSMASHFLLAQIKCAAHFAFLHGRNDITDLDWELAGIEMQVVKRELAGIWKRSQEARIEEITRRGVEKGVEMHAAYTNRSELEDADFQKLCQSVFHKLFTDGPLRNSEIRSYVGGGARKKAAVPHLIQELLDKEWIARDTSGRYWAVMHLPTGTVYLPEDARQRLNPVFG